MFGVPIPLSVALAGFPGASGAPRAGLEAIARGPVRAVQLDLTAEDLRPRAVGRSARRDLVALLRRLELNCSGFDMFIPPDHLTTPAHADRAMAAFSAGLEMAGELATLAASAGSGRVQPVLAVRLPEKVAPAIVDVLSGTAERCGAVLADFSARELDPARESRVHVGLDTSESASRGDDPAVRIAALGPRLAALRWTNTLRSSPGVRCEPSDARGVIDATTICASLAVSGFSGHAVIDLRGLSPRSGVLDRACNSWTMSV